MNATFFNALDVESLSPFLFPEDTASISPKQFAYPSLRNHHSISALMIGVQFRLSSSILKVRLHGMRVAEVFSQALAIDSVEAIQFDELRDSNQDSAIDSEQDISCLSCVDCSSAHPRSLLDLLVL